MLITIYGDGSNSTSRKDSDGGAGAVILIKEDTVVNRIIHLGRYLKVATNNIAEISAIKLGIEWIINNHFQNVKILAFSDSQYCCGILNKSLGINNWEYNAKKNVELVTSVREQINTLENFKIEWMRGHSNHIYNDTAHYLANSSRVKKQDYYDDRIV